MRAVAKSHLSGDGLSVVFTLEHFQVSLSGCHSPLFLIENVLEFALLISLCAICEKSVPEYRV